MKKIINKIPENIRNILFGIILAAVGVFVLIYPNASLTTVCIIAGLGTLIFGIIRISGYISDNKVNLGNPRDLVTGIVYLILASSLLLHPKFLLSFLPFLIGSSVAFYGISSLLSPERGTFSKIISVAVILFGVSLMFNPYKGATAMTSFVGFGLIVWGIITVVSEILAKKKAAPPKSDDGYTEVEFRDVP